MHVQNDHIFGRKWSLCNNMFEYLSRRTYWQGPFSSLTLLRNFNINFCGLHELATQSSVFFYLIFFHFNLLAGSSRAKAKENMKEVRNRSPLKERLVEKVNKSKIGSKSLVKKYSRRALMLPSLRCLLQKGEIEEKLQDPRPIKGRMADCFPCSHNQHGENHCLQQRHTNVRIPAVVED